MRRRGHYCVFCVIVACSSWLQVYFCFHIPGIVIYICLPMLYAKRFLINISFLFSFETFWSNCVRSYIYVCVKIDLQGREEDVSVSMDAMRGCPGEACARSSRDNITNLNTPKCSFSGGVCAPFSLVGSLWVGRRSPS